jgi:transposase
MRFYTNLHPYYCGIDLHSRNLYICIIDEFNEVVHHQNIPACPEQLYAVLQPYIGNMVVGVECMHCWYWVADFCEHHGIDFILGHALYMKAIHGGKAKNDRIDALKIAKLIKGGNFPLAFTYPAKLRALRDLMRRRLHLVRYSASLKAHVKNTQSQYNHSINHGDLRYAPNRQMLREAFANHDVQCMVDMDLNLIDHHDKEVKRVEGYIKRQLKKHHVVNMNLLKSINGVGDVLACTILLEIGDLTRFANVKQFASYSRLVKCKAESAGKSYGTQGNKIGNAHLKWAFSELATLFIRNNDSGKAYLAKLEKRMPKSKALSVLAHKLGRAVFFMLKHQKVFDEQRFIKG